MLLGEKAKECHSKLTEALGNRALPYRTVARWAVAFQRGRVYSSDMRRTGRQRTVCTDVVRAVIAQCLEDDRWWSLQELQAHTCIDQATVHKIVQEDLHMHKIAAKWCHMHLLNNKNGVAMKLVVFIWKSIKMKERTCWTTLSLLMEDRSRLYEPELMHQSAEWRHEGSMRR